MSEVKLNVDGTAAAQADGLGQGFLGTGQSLVGELSLIAMVLIFGYVAFSLVRYYLPEFRPFGAIAGVLGLSER